MKHAHSVRIKVKTHILSKFVRPLGLMHANEFTKSYSHIITPAVYIISSLWVSDVGVLKFPCPRGS